MLAIPGGQVRVYVDGFNLYHGIKTHPQNKWLDIHALCRLLVAPAVTKISVHYYTAYANHTSTNTVGRHRQYVAALEETGVSVTIGRFKRKQLRCKASCHEEYMSYEEKETDVNLAVAITEDALLGHYDSLVLVSGDTDLLPALKAARRHGKGIYALFPPGRKNDDLARLCDAFSRIRTRHIEKCQLPDPLVAADGMEIHCPAPWKHAQT